MAKAKVTAKKKAPQRAAQKPKLNLNQLNAKIVDMFNRHPPLTLTFSKVSRWTKVPRSTLYYYYGNSREKMIVAAVNACVIDFLSLDTELNPARFDSWFDLQVAFLQHTSEIVDRYPWAPDLYYRYRMDPGYIGTSVREIEEKYFFERTKSWLHFYPKIKPSLTATKMASALKLGMLYGVQIETAAWCGPENHHKRTKLIEYTTQYLQKILETPWETLPTESSKASKESL